MDLIKCCRTQQSTSPRFVFIIPAAAINMLLCKISSCCFLFAFSCGYRHFFQYMGICKNLKYVCAQGVKRFTKSRFTVITVLGSWFSVWVGICCCCFSVFFYTLQKYHILHQHKICSLTFHQQYLKNQLFLKDMSCHHFLTLRLNTS